MPQKFVNLENLTSFWGNAKEYIGNERKEIEDQLYNWQKTEKAPVVQCEPVPNSDLHPIVDFMFTETPPASGEKGPENPSTITGVSSAKVIRCGKNLIPIPYEGQSGTISGVSFTVNNDGTILVNGTASTKIVFILNRYIRFNKNIQYFLSGCPNASGSSFSINIDFRRTYDTGYIQTISDVGNGKKYTPSIDCYGSSYISIPSGTTVSNLVFKPQLELGSTATTFEPYSGADYTIDLGGTFYGGSVDLSTGTMTVTHHHEIVDETSNFQSTGFFETPDTYRFYFFGKGPVRKKLDSLGTDYVSNKCDFVFHDYIGTSLNKATMMHTRYDAGLYIWVSKQDINVGDGLSFNEVLPAVKAWLSSNPIEIIYPLNTPLAVQLTPQQIKSLPSLEDTSKRINTIYTDVDSVQVEYQKYVGIDSILDSDSVNAIQNKAVNSALNTKVSLFGDETINGTKTFSNTINGSVTGDAGTVAGHIVSKDVPVNAAFTDTTYEPATQSTAGLMSAADKTKLDAVGSVFTFKGSVIDDTYLPASDNASGDAYLAEDTGHVHVYNGSSFVDIGTWAGIPSATDAQIDALFED